VGKTRRKTNIFFGTTRRGGLRNLENSKRKKEWIKRVRNIPKKLVKTTFAKMLENNAEDKYPLANAKRLSHRKKGGGRERGQDLKRNFLVVLDR